MSPADPYQAFADELRREVARIAEDPDAGAAALEAAFDDVGRRARVEAARAVFDRLDPAEQWAVLARTFPDDELAEALADARARVLADADRHARLAAVRVGDGLALTALADGERLTLGLFREQDVDSGRRLGPAARSCARRLVVRGTGTAGEVQVVEDVFNPDGGYFVTADYDETTWRHQDRLPPHALVRLGTIVPVPTGDRFDPVLRLGGRVDVDVDGDHRSGCLHLGWARLDDLDVFPGPGR